MIKPEDIDGLPLNAYQKSQLLALLLQLTEDNAVALSFGERPLYITRVEPFECEVPGMMAASHDDPPGVIALLYPTPKPVNKDPLFQPPEPVKRWDRFRRFLSVFQAPGWKRDFAWSGADLDAPNEMPAGSLLAFDHGDDIYGAEQSTLYRE